MTVKYQDFMYDVKTFFFNSRKSFQFQIKYFVVNYIVLHKD